MPSSAAAISITSTATTAQSNGSSAFPIAGPLLSQKPVVLWFHDPGTYANQDAVVNPDQFPNFRDGQLLRIHFPQQSQQQQQTTQQQQQQQQQQQPTQQQQQQQQQSAASAASTVAQKQPQQSQQQPQPNGGAPYQQPQRPPLIVKATSADREALARQQHLQISISRDIADRFNLRSRQEVYLELIDPSAAALDHVELSVKEQYLGRSDMWRLQQHLRGTCVYTEKKIVYAGVIKATVRRQFANDVEMMSGYIDENTRMIFRSSSAKYFVYIQMSREMWEFDEDGQLYYEKVVNHFLPELFQKWKQEGTNHVVSFVLFTRVFYDDPPVDDALVNKTEDGRYYKDFYKVVADWETVDDWMAIIGPLKDEQLKFQQGVLMRDNNDGEPSAASLHGRIAMAYEGNVLEAVNLALNPFDNHYVDRDLMRTGLSIILITPGPGKFEASKKLLRLTNERMTDNGIAMDMVCLSPLPLHVTPLFVYKSSPPPPEMMQDQQQQYLMAPSTQPRYKGAGGSPETKTMMMWSKHKRWDPLYEDDALPNTYTYYSVPHWIDCSFYNQGYVLQKRDKFRTRCKMYELQMMGIMEHDLAGISIPYLNQQQQQGASDPSSSRLRTQRSSSSLNDKISKSIDSTTGNGEAYLSRSANFASIRHQHSLLQYHQQQAHGDSRLTAADYARYDASVFKGSPEPRFGRRTTPAATATASTPSQKIMTPTKQKSSFESPERAQDAENWLLRNTGLKSNMTWHHGDQRRVMSILSQSQQAASKISFDSNVRKDDHPMRASDIFKGPSPGRGPADDGGSGSGAAIRVRPSRRGTVNSSQVGPVAAVDSPGSSAMAVDDEDLMLVSSSTVDPVPIKSGVGTGIGSSGSRTAGTAVPGGGGAGAGGGDARKSNNPSPRQVGSVPSVHKHSGNSDMALRTSFGGQHRTSSSPSHSSPAAGRNSALKNVMINPCNPSDYTMLFTSYLRRWMHALPRVDQYDGPRVHWRSLTSPACLPLTTDYFPSNEELVKDYLDYMYTVSASEDVNLYQAGDRSISEHKRTANLLQEMISQRLAQGFQIIVDVTGSSSSHHHGVQPKPTLSGTAKMYDTFTGTGGGSGGGLATGAIKDMTSTPMLSSGSGPSGVGSGGPTGGGIGSGFGGPPAATAGGGGASAVPGGGGTTTTSTTTIAMSKAIARNDAEQDTTKWKHMVWWLSMGHQVHQLTFDSSCQNVEVRRYVRQIRFDTKKTGYKCAIWPKNLPTYRPKRVSFSYPSLMYAWNYLDHLVAGYQEELTDNLRFWRSRFIVIPRETLPANTPLSTHAPGGPSLNTLDDEEKRLALFDIWLQNLRKAKSLSPQERDEMQKNRRRKELTVSDFGLRITTMDPSAYVTNEAIKPIYQQQPDGGSGSTSIGNGESPLFSHPSTSSLLSTFGGTLGQQQQQQHQALSLSRESKSKDIAHAMRDPKTGVRMADRRWHFKVYSYSFIGSEFVDWLIGHFADINTREEAVAFGNALMQRKPPLYASSTSRHGFLDGHYFYRLHNDYLPKQQQQQQTQRTWFTMKSKALSGGAANGTSSSGAASSSGGNKDKDAGLDALAPSASANASQQQQQQGSGTTAAPSDQPTGRQRRRSIDFEMTREMIIDVDPYKKSDRRETAILHYDTVHNANNCYHFQINWLGCMAQLVQELVQNWSRQAERCGLLVVEGSVDQAYDDSENNNPFQCPVPIDLAVRPPSVAELNAAAAASGGNNYGIPDNIYEAALVRHMGFVLDVEADSKFERAREEGVHPRYSFHKEPYKYDQYIHRSGVAFVQIRPGNSGFYWVNNRLYTNHTPSLVMMGRRRAAAAASSSAEGASANFSNMQHPEFLRQQFHDFCSDPVRLAEFWESTRHNLLAEHHTGAEAWVFENAQVVLSGDIEQQSAAVPPPSTAASPAPPAAQQQLPLRSPQDETASTVDTDTASLAPSTAATAASAKSPSPASNTDSSSSSNNSAVAPSASIIVTRPSTPSSPSASSSPQTITSKNTTSDVS